MSRAGVRGAWSLLAGAPAAPAYAQDIVRIPEDQERMLGALYAATVDGMIIERSAEPTDLDTQPCLETHVDLALEGGVHTLTDVTLQEGYYLQGVAPAPVQDTGFLNVGGEGEVDWLGGADRVFPEQGGDGHDALTDCDDLDASIYPGAIDDSEDHIDQSCDGVDGLGGDTADPSPPAVGLSGGCTCSSKLEGRAPIVVIWGLLIMVFMRRQRCSHPC